MSTFFDGIVDKKILDVLIVFLKNETEYFHITQVSEISKVPLATTFRIIHSLEKKDFLEKKTLSKLKIYRLKKNKKTRFYKRHF